MANGEKPVDLRDFKSDISLMQTVYAILLILGFRQLGDALYSFATTGVGGSELLLLLSLGGLTLAFLGVRFFWAVGNIRRYALHHENDTRLNVRRRITTLHFPVLLIHAMLFYFLCRLHSEMTSVETFHDKAELFLRLYVSFLFLNVGWLVLLVRGREDKRPEIIWVMNNSITGLFALGLYYWFRINNHNLAFLLACIALLLNSFFDLWLTADTYIAKSTEKA